MNIIVTIDSNHLKNISGIADSLRGLGVRIENVLKMGGIITGSVSEKKDISQLKIKGVKSIELSKKVRAI